MPAKIGNKDSQQAPNPPKFEGNIPVKGGNRQLPKSNPAPKPGGK